MWPFKMAMMAVMDVSVAEAKNRHPELIRAVEEGEKVVITRHGKPVAQLTGPPRETRRIQWGAMRGRIKLQPGWDDSIDLDRFLAGDL
ncbi:MAG: type II toxin-antitoxin system prevent-host-death family antitoxin [Acidobacteriia bacterium]|nr:type II toxin-antitoxin system prevent-host-death family antitoxin [Terriglobia bacterium]MBV8903046.1 type II toxin-antitoxin system prevent-host-death family antitoxin [Terriglobia bacterium]